MSFESVVVNSSPLICLIKIGRENLFPALFKQVVVPNAVFEEITTGGHGDLPAKKLPDLSWLMIESISGKSRNNSRNSSGPNSSRGVIRFRLL